MVFRPKTKLNILKQVDKQKTRAISFTLYIQEVAKTHLTKDLNFLKFYNMFKIFEKLTQQWEF